MRNENIAAISPIDIRGSIGRKPMSELVQRTDTDSTYVGPRE